MCAYKKPLCFTLCELLIVLVIMGILASLAIPSFTSQIRNNRSITMSEELMAAVQVRVAKPLSVLVVFQCVHHPMGRHAQVLGRMDI